MALEGYGAYFPLDDNAWGQQEDVLVSDGSSSALGTGTSGGPQGSACRQHVDLESLGPQTHPTMIHASRGVRAAQPLPQRQRVLQEEAIPMLYAARAAHSLEAHLQIRRCSLKERGRASP